MDSREQWQSLLAGGIALLVGVGFGRYAFTALIPPIVEAGWFSSQQTAVLGAVNLLGYLVGAMTGDRLARQIGVRRSIGLALNGVIVGLLACAVPVNMVWYAIWRFVTGWAACILTVVVIPVVISRVPASRRPLASAVVFTGMGIGIIGSSLIVPALARAGVDVTWIVIAAVALLLAGWSWRAVWRHLPPEPGPARRAKARLPVESIPWLALVLLIAAYALSAIGYMPQSLYWVDYIARELGKGLFMGNMNWLLLGCGGVIGPGLAGFAAARLGFRQALVVAFGLLALGTWLPLISSSLPVLGGSSLVVGAMVPAVITLTAGVIADLAPHDAHRRLWGWATIAYAATQAFGAFGMSHLYAAAGSYWITIAAGAALLTLGTLFAACVSRCSQTTRGQV